MWKLIGWILSRRIVATAIINYAKRTPYFHLPSNDNPNYMERYWVFNPYMRENNEQRGSKYPWFPWNIRVHHIKRHDREQHLHDHPWNARTIILSGWYQEERLVDHLPKPDFLSEPAWKKETHLRVRGDTAMVGYQQFHRIVRVMDGGAWTLFISGPYQGFWGFLVDGVKIHYKKYLKL